MSNAKRSKKHRPREIRQPMMAVTHDALALELRLAVEALILAPSIESYNQLSLMTSALSTAGVAGTAIDLACSALGQICDRFDRLKKVGVSGDEAAALRRAVDGLDADLASIPNNRFRAAVAVTRHAFDKLRHSQDAGAA